MWNRIVEEYFGLGISEVNQIITLIQEHINKCKSEKLFWEYNWAGPFIQSIEPVLVATIDSARVEFRIEDESPPKLTIQVKCISYKSNIKYLIIDICRLSRKELRIGYGIKSTGNYQSYFRITETQTLEV